MQVTHSAGHGWDDLEQENDPIKMSLGSLLAAFWRARGIVVFAAFLGGAISLSYITFLRTPQYMASAMVAPIESGGGGGVKQAAAAFAGIDLGGMSSGDFDKFLHLLHSVRLAEVLQRKYGLMADAYPGQWDYVKHEWKKPSGTLAAVKAGIKSVLGLPPWSPPTASGFSVFLTKKIELQRVAGSSPLDLKNKTTIVSVELDDREEALRFLQLAIREADEISRQDQLTNTERRISYLTKLLDQTQEVYLKQSLQQLLMGEEQTLITARANKFYSIDMIDTPNADSIPTGTPPLKILIMGTMIGIFAALGFIYMVIRWRMQVAKETGEDPFVEPIVNPFSLAIYWLVSRYRDLRGGDQ